MESVASNYLRTMSEPRKFAKIKLTKKYVKKKFFFFFPEILRSQITFNLLPLIPNTALVLAYLASFKSYGKKDPQVKKTIS